VVLLLDSFVIVSCLLAALDVWPGLLIWGAAVNGLFAAAELAAWMVGWVAARRMQ
jgi:hypothetical protein